jgi:hypothetical protein
MSSRTIVASARLRRPRCVPACRRVRRRHDDDCRRAQRLRRRNVFYPTANEAARGGSLLSDLAPSHGPPAACRPQWHSRDGCGRLKPISFSVGADLETGSNVVLPLVFPRPGPATTRSAPIKSFQENRREMPKRRVRLDHAILRCGREPGFKRLLALGDGAKRLGQEPKRGQIVWQGALAAREWPPACAMPSSPPLPGRGVLQVPPSAGLAAGFGRILHG